MERVGFEPTKERKPLTAVPAQCNQPGSAISPVPVISHLLHFAHPKIRWRCKTPIERQYKPDDEHNTNCDDPIYDQVELEPVPPQPDASPCPAPTLP